MSILIVVSNPRDWPLAIPDVTVVSARVYLTDPAYGSQLRARVFNLCKSYRYQSLGYYVSLLAEARGHKPFPRVNAIEDLQSPGLVRLITENLDERIQKSLSAIKSEHFELSIYFGHNVAKHYDQLSRQLFNLLQAPLLRAYFDRHDGQWRLRSIKTIAASDIPPQHQDFVVQAATDYFSGRKPWSPRLIAPRYDLAILRDPNDPEPPSNAKAMKQFEKAAENLGMHVEFITRTDFGRLPEFDALFIRDTTYVNHYTYRFSRRAAAEGLVVIDDPNSILKCNNKVYLAELLTRRRIPVPRTLLVHRDNVEQVIPTLTLPCVLKQPDSSFSLGVAKVETEKELRCKVNELLGKSELIVAQEYLPTEFDWRVAILDRRPLFVCKYFMAPGHWQIVKHGGQKRDYVEGLTQAVSLEEAPTKVVKMALKAANLIGDGFYGVDIKQVGKRCYVIEINDNPNVDAGNEDGILQDDLYQQIMTVFLHRLDRHKQGEWR
ncbi:RimK family protein [Nitrosomonas sp. Nm132]|uniref:RimK family protein n=1 Tax=Nitrosomonas sp. Nm132 TaxID=1881053 RepID=UPI000887BD76|nr:RimK family protein [Nitrosomonas sp. Nm132]SDI07991.1 Glutathione synthase/RimK-type ligase, ATP-grasp superfamily [Nitrosomonas sp. Nm132]